jgi:hypothetical protein
MNSKSTELTYLNNSSVIIHLIYLEKKLIHFSLEEFSNKFMNLDPNFFMYYGSKTTPPCAENILYIVVDKPIQLPGCQFKLLRENSKISTHAKEIHTRLEKPLAERTVYVFRKDIFSYLPSLIGLIPQSYNKYLVTYGPTYMIKLFYKFGPKAKGGKYGKWFKKNGKKIKFALGRRGTTPWWLTKGAIGKIPAGNLDEIDCSIEKTDNSN